MKIYLILFCLLFSHFVVFGNGYQPHSQAIAHPMIHEGLLTNPYESLVIGNGDVAVSANMLSHQLILQIGKNDVWDSRTEFTMDDVMMTHDQLIEANGEAEGLFDFGRAHSSSFVNSPKQGPTPKPAGIIKVTHPGLSNTKVLGKVDISTGILTIEYGFNEGGILCIEVFVHKNKNLVISRFSAKGKIPWFCVSIEKSPDYVDSEIPDPVITKGSSGNQWSISQTIKEKHGTPDFSWHLGCLFPQSYVLNWRYALEQRISLADNDNVELAIGIATDRDGTGNSLERAFELSSFDGKDWYEKEKEKHIEGWNKFWSKSSIEIEDKELEALWYRTMFGFACHLSPHAQAPGLNANIPIFDYSAWNGDYHWNHNVQKWYFPALPVNHGEWYETFAMLVKQHNPIFKRYANQIFGLEGVYVDLYTYPFIPSDRAKIYGSFGRALAHTGWISQMLYLHYEFTGDKEWLKENAYPYLSEAADFYANYMDKYQKEDLVIFPSMLLEDTDNWKKGFPENRNVITDLIMFRKAFESAIHAADLLELDKTKRKNWEKKLDRVPEIEYGWNNGKGWYGIYKDWQKVWPDFDEYLYHLRTSRWGCSGWTIFPGEHINGDEETGLAVAVRDVLAGTDLMNLPNRTLQLGTFHGEANFLPFVRAGIMEKYDDLRTLLLNHRFMSGQFSPFSTGDNIFPRDPAYSTWRIVENQYFPILGITEMLLQSQGNVIRFFPYWPMEQKASFKEFRARGGFVISASWDPDSGIMATISSQCGNLCRIRWKQNEKPVITCNGKQVAFSRQGRDIVFKTHPNLEYVLKNEL